MSGRAQASSENFFLASWKKEQDNAAVRPTVVVIGGKSERLRYWDFFLEIQTRK